ncbi:hypothetical protein [uncultured Sphingomonas sp.]|uniref:hypothetical protein n=1 Tax=uncultured Sphingomonas sp. TaxID=158754 RepID=UPI003747FDBA
MNEWRKVGSGPLLLNDRFWVNDACTSHRNRSRFVKPSYLSSFPKRGLKGLIRGAKTFRQVGWRGGFGGRPILYAASPASVMR